MLDLHCINWPSVNPAIDNAYIHRNQILEGSCNVYKL